VATAISPATAETLRPEMSDLSSTEVIAAFERNDLGGFAMFIEARPQTTLDLLENPIATSSACLDIECEKSGQCE
jgi:hypothetical protein